MRLLRGYICPIIILFASLTLGEEIKATALLFRHAERAPLFNVGPLYNSQVDKVGPSEQTQAGSREMYLNGLFLRLRYSHLLPEDELFRVNNMRILSSPEVRCVMSTQAFMAGLLPPASNDTTIPLMWQPFAMQVDNDGDIIYFESKNCPVYMEMFATLLADPPAEVAEMIVADQPAFEQIGKELGFPITNLLDIIGVAEWIRSTAVMEDEYVPQWALDAYTKTLEKYLARLLAMSHETEFMLKVRAGPMLREIVNNMEAVQSGSEDERKFIIYSSHDMTILNLAQAMGVYDQIPWLPYYSDTIMIELVDSENGGELKVQVVYVSYLTAIPNLYNLDVPGCGKQCSLSTFKALVEKYFVKDLRDICISSATRLPNLIFGRLAGVGTFLIFWILSRRFFVSIN